jgi:hypothetical protein
MRRLLTLLCVAFGLSACGASQGAGPPSTLTTPPPISSATPAMTVSADEVQPQLAPGSCHATGRAPYALPDRRCTPGALNPAVTQATINHTICVPGYTETIRPSESITQPQNISSNAAYGVGGRTAHGFEYDHLVPLELGGAVNDPRNLWPEPGDSPNPKDSVERVLSELVCRGRVSLAFAQRLIASNWIAAGQWVHDHFPSFDSRVS